MTSAEIKQASEMWAKGMIGRRIAEYFGITENQFWRVTKANRDFFPRRDRWFSAGVDYQPMPAEEDHSETMKWTTQSGSVVTLPRVRFLEERK